jgi:hypothetical protein
MAIPLKKVQKYQRSPKTRKESDILERREFIKTRRDERLTMDWQTSEEIKQETDVGTGEFRLILHERQIGLLKANQCYHGASKKKERKRKTKNTNYTQKKKKKPRR